MMDRGTVRNMQSFIPKIYLRNQCIQLVLLQEIKPTWCTIFLSVFISFLYMFQATSPHHQEKQLYICDILYLSLCMDDCLVCRVHTRQSSTQNNEYQACTPDSHPHRKTSTKRHTDTVISPGDGHIVAHNMYRKEINTPRKVRTNLQDYIYCSKSRYLAQCTEV